MIKFEGIITSEKNVAIGMYLRDDEVFIIGEFDNQFIKGVGVKIDEDKNSEYIGEIKGNEMIG